jgi:hypothetical protein
VVGILGALHQFGYIGPHEPERGALTIKPQIASGVTRAGFLTDYARTGQPPPSYPAVSRGDQGYVFSIDVALDHAESNRYSLRWTMQTASMGQKVRPFENLLGDRFGASQASRIHRVWVPCPRTEHLFIVAEFALIDEKRPEAPLDTGASRAVECRTAEH